jgi:predicted dehydrogenase
MWAPRTDNNEALKMVVQEFVDAIDTGRAPLTDGEAGLKIVRILEAATHSMAFRGQVLELARGAAV